MSVVSDDVDGHEGIASDKRLGAESAVRGYVIASMGIGLVPVPVFDLAALIGLQLKMVHNLCETYEVKFSHNLGKSTVISLIGGVMPVAVTASFASVLKIIPGFGSLAASASVAVLGGALTYAVGRIFIEHFESGGTLLDFDPAAYHDRFRKAFVRGRQVASDLKSDDDTARTDQTGHG